MRFRFFVFTAVFCLAFTAVVSAQTGRTINVITEPGAIVWVDDVRRGTTDASGGLIIRPLATGIRKIRVRADGFKEITQNLAAAQKGDVKIALVKTTDKAELAYQAAERLTQEDRDRAVEMYETAVRLRPKYAEAHLGLARVLSDQGEMDQALAAIKNARLARAVYPEASAVEGRIFKELGDEEKALAAFERAVKEGKGFQPEALTGLGLLYKEKAGMAGSSGDFDAERLHFEQATRYLQKAVEQLSASEPVVYLLLGEIYERLKLKKEAIALYEQFLEDFPDNSERTAVQSFIVQLKKTPAP